MEIKNLLLPSSASSFFRSFSNVDSPNRKLTIICLNVAFVFSFLFLLGMKDVKAQTVPPPPIISSFSVSPNNGSSTEGYIGSTITINGQYFTTASSVKLGSVTISNFKIVNDNQITLIVPSVFTDPAGTIFVRNNPNTANGVRSNNLPLFRNLGFITTASGKYTDATTWLGGVLPPTNADVTIANNDTVNVTARNADTVTVNQNATLYFNNSNINPILTASSVFNNGIIDLSGTLFGTPANQVPKTLSATTIINNGTFAYLKNVEAKATIYTNNGTLSWTTGGGTLVINSATTGTLINNGTFTAGNGTVNFENSSTIPGIGQVNGLNSITFNNLSFQNSDVNLTSNRSVLGLLTIGGNGKITPSPIYGPNSTLWYATGYTRSNEWNAVTGTIGVTPGYPNNVTIDKYFSLNLGTTTDILGLTGNLTLIDPTTNLTGTGATINFSGSAAPQTVTFNGTIPNGNVINYGVTNPRGIIVKGTLPVKQNSSFGAAAPGKAVTSGVVAYESGTTLYYISTQGAQTTGGEFPLLNGPENLVINNTSTSNTVTLGANGGISGLLTLTKGTLDLSNFNLTLKAGTDGTYPIQNNPLLYPTTAVIGPVGASSGINYSGTGRFVVERFIPANRKYRFISPSVTTSSSIFANWMESQTQPPIPGYGTHITGGASGGFDVTLTNNPSLFTYNTASQSWVAAPDTKSTLTAGIPWRLIVRGDRTISLNTNTPTPTPTILRTTGKLTVGPITYNTSAGPVPLSPKQNSYTFIGNPFAAPINWDAIERTDLNDTYWTTDPNSNNNGTNGSWVSYSSSTGPSFPSSEVNNIIQPGQGFFVQTQSAASTTPNPSLILREENKSTGVFTNVFRTSATLTKLYVQLLFNKNGGNQNIADGAAVAFADNFSKTIGKEDTYKFTNQNENIGINRNDTILSVEGRPSITDNDTIPLKIWQYRQKSYYLRLFGNNFPGTVSALVKDTYLNIDTPVNLSDTTYLQFNITSDSASFASGRFSIIFKSNSILPVTVTNVKAYQKEKGIQVEWTALTETNIDRYEVEKSSNGQSFNKIASVKANGNGAAIANYGWFNADVNDGSNYYRIKVIEKSGAIKYTSVVHVNIAQGNSSSVVVLQNPVKGNVITIKLNNIEKGKYNVVLYNNAGQKIYKGTIVHNGEPITYTFKPGSTLAKGTYTLQVSNGELSLNKQIMAD